MPPGVIQLPIGCGRLVHEGPLWRCWAGGQCPPGPSLDSKATEGGLDPVPWSSSATGSLPSTSSSLQSQRQILQKWTEERPWGPISSCYPHNAIPHSAVYSTQTSFWLLWSSSYSSLKGPIKIYFPFLNLFSNFSGFISVAVIKIPQQKATREERDLFQCNSWLHPYSPQL